MALRSKRSGCKAALKPDEPPLQMGRIQKSLPDAQNLVNLEAQLLTGVGEAVAQSLLRGEFAARTKDGLEGIMLEVQVQKVRWIHTVLRVKKLEFVAAARHEFGAGLGLTQT